MSDPQDKGASWIHQVYSDTNPVWVQEMDQRLSQIRAKTETLTVAADREGFQASYTDMAQFHQDISHNVWKMSQLLAQVAPKEPIPPMLPKDIVNVQDVMYTDVTNQLLVENTIYMVGTVVIGCLLLAAIKLTASGSHSLDSPDLD